MEKIGQHRLRNRELFQKVLQKGQSVRGSFLALYWLHLPEESRSQVGYAVGKKLGNAVVRNRLRRQIKHVQAACLHQLKDGYAMVWLARKYSLGASFQDLQIEMDGLLRKADLLTEDHAAKG